MNSYFGTLRSDLLSCSGVDDVAAAVVRIYSNCGLDREYHHIKPTTLEFLLFELVSCHLYSCCVPHPRQARLPRSQV